MLAEIGIMVGFYIIVRYISFGTRKEPAEKLVVVIFSAIGAIITLIIIFDLMVRGFSQGNMPR
jgi:hypothetical protein